MSDAQALTVTEQVAVRALSAQMESEREKYAAAVSRILREDAALSREIEARLGLPELALERTHEVDHHAWTVRPKATPAPVVAEGENA